MNHAPSTRFLFIRHAQTTWNHDKRYAGSGEVPLAEESIDQIAHLTAFLDGQVIDAMYASPLTRCLQTVKGVAEHHHKRIIVREELRERFLGDWQGKSASEIHTNAKQYHFPESAYNGDLHVPHAELLENLEHRVRTLLHELTEAHPGQTVALGTHAGVIWMTLARIVSNTPSEILWPGNCAVYEVISENRGFLVQGIHALEDYSKTLLD